MAVIAAHPAQPQGIICRELLVRLHGPNGLHARYVNRSLADQMLRAGFVTVCLLPECAYLVVQPGSRLRTFLRSRHSTMCREV